MRNENVTSGVWMWGKGCFKPTN